MSNTDALLLVLIDLLVILQEKDGYHINEVHALQKKAHAIFYTPPKDIEELIKKYKQGNDKP